MYWVAGSNPIVRLSFAEKEKLFGEKFNFQGFEYYMGGIFQFKSSNPLVPDNTDLTGSFDWRNRHGANNPTSLYYDGDVLGGGWLTAVDNQSCNHCWVFSPVHTTEGLINVYFNQHLDIDLSEQEVASCSGGNIGECNEGEYIHIAVDYIVSSDIKDEDCFPYSGQSPSSEPCYPNPNNCNNPNYLVNIASKDAVNYNDEEIIKLAVIENGPITCGIDSWNHFMVLVGFDVINEGDTY